MTPTFGRQPKHPTVSYTTITKVRATCRRCGWTTTGEENSVRSKAMRHGEGCGLCEAHGHAPGSGVIKGCTCAPCAPVLKAQRNAGRAADRAKREGGTTAAPDLMTTRIPERKR